MTDKQRDYILGLDETLLDFSRWDSPEFFSKDILGKDWLDHYKDISHQDASNCINKLNEEIEKVGCTDWCDVPFGIDYEVQ